MRKFRQLRTAFTLSVLMGMGMAVSAPQLNAATSNDQSSAVHCALAQRALATAIALGADDATIAYLQGLVTEFCGS